MLHHSSHLAAVTSPGKQSSLQRIRAEYQEMPGLRLTCEQVARLCGLDRSACEQLLEALVDCKYLERAADARYALPADLRTARRKVEWVAAARLPRSWS